MKMCQHGSEAICDLCDPRAEALRLVINHALRQMPDLQPPSLTFHGIPIEYGDLDDMHYGDVAGYYQGYPLHANFVSHGSSSGSVTLVRTGPCSHKWGPWKACGGRFDHRGPIETLYSRWCSLCREGEETRTADRL
jgi:hypothetical protein